MPLDDDRLSVGSILFEYVYHTTPPKEKYYIIIGFSQDKVALGTVYINTGINNYFHHNPDLLKLHLPIHVIDYPFLKWDSHVDCSNIQVRDVSDVQACILSGNPAFGYCSSISPSELAAIIKALDSARTISPIIKKKFGIRK